MKENKKELMLERLSQNKNDKLRFAPVIEESQAKEIEPPTKEEIKEVKKIIKEEQKQIKGKSKRYNPNRKNYIISQDILEKMAIIEYMDRDIKDQTDLVNKALKKFVNSEANKRLIEEYNNIKGGNK